MKSNWEVINFLLIFLVSDWNIKKLIVYDNWRNWLVLNCKLVLKWNWEDVLWIIKILVKFINNIW